MRHDMTKNERKNCKTLVEEAKTTTGGRFGKLHIQGQGNSRGNDNCQAAPTLKHEGNQIVNKTNHNYEKLDNKEEDMLFLYTNVDCLPNKLQELKQLLVHLEESPDIISLTEMRSNTKTSEK